LLGICLATAAWFAGADALNAADEAAAPRLFEMRTYTANEGKFEALHKRFRDHTCKLFEKHGMTNIGYWTPTEGPGKDNTLVYLLAYPNREARDASWKAFMADPEWQAVYKESHKDGPLVSKVDSKFLAPTDYSLIK
jgi:hypothetical protein